MLLGVPPHQFLPVSIAPLAGQVVLVTVPATARRVVVGVEAVGVAALESGFVVAVGFGSVGGLGMLRMAGRRPRPHVVVVDAHRLDAIAQLPVVRGSVSLGLELGFALTVRRCGLFEDVDDVLALQAVSERLEA